MPEHQIDPYLSPWSKVEGEWKSLLLGNGFSMNIWSKFGYKTLYEVAKSEAAPPLSADSIGLFEKLDSTNFEDVLRVLFHASLVDDQLKSPQRPQIETIYKSTKNALAGAVNYSHVPHGFKSLAELNKLFLEFDNIFTTNYDLIPYWAIMQDVSGFRDFFWNDGGIFDPSDTKIIGKKCVIFYLHGAIHLVELPDGRTKKLTAGINSLSELFDLDHPDHFPLFISEGSSDRKLARIKKNDYLRFSFERLRSIDGDLVVLGHSLHKDYDQHLLNALQDGKLTSIAIGVWPHQPAKEILVFKARVLAEIKDKKIYFFDSTTHPLGSPNLKHEA